MTLLARIKAHSQQICGLAWSPDGEQFATGGNDNLCCLFGVDKILEIEHEGDCKDEPVSHVEKSRLDDHTTPKRRSFTATKKTSATDGDSLRFVYPVSPLSPIAPISPIVDITLGDWYSNPISLDAFGSHLIPSESPGSVPSALPPSPLIPAVKNCLVTSALQTWGHLAAVKAIAFCPWRQHLLATGGGSNDKMIHFFHTTSGAALATIAVSAQVTSLIWSTTRREIAATFGYAQPDHAVRIAVFSWPECRMIGSVKWDGEHRALFAVGYPGGLSEASPPSTSSTPPITEVAGNGTPEESESTRDKYPSRIGGARRKRRRADIRPKREGCLIVACSDESVKFHEVWGTGRGKASTVAGLGQGVLGGSDIIEMAEGIDKEGDIIR